MNMSPRKRRQIRFFIGVILALNSHLFLIANLTYPSFNYWGNAVGGLVASLLTAMLVGRVVGKNAGFAVALGLGGTWGVIVISVFIIQSRITRSGLIVLLYVLIAIAFAEWWGRRRDRKVSGKLPDPALPALTP